MRGWTSSVGATVAALSLGGCLVMPVRGNGVEATESRARSGFSAVRNTMSIDVTVVEGEPGVAVTCDANLVDLIRTSVEGETLVVFTELSRSIAPHGPCAVEVSVASLAALGNSGSGGLFADGDWTVLEEVHASGSGPVVVTGIDTDHLEASMSGSGEMVLAGFADSVALSLSGSGTVDALDLSTVDAEVHLSGSGGVNVTASGAVDVHLSGSGQVRIGGHPDAVTQHVSGSGRVHVD